MDVRDRASLVEKEFSLLEFLAFLKKVRWRIVSFVAISTLGAAAAGLLLPKSYRVSVVLAPVVTTMGAGQGAGLSSVLSQFGGLASLVGGMGGSDMKRSESVAVLKSEALAEHYIAQNHLLPVLYASLWDPSTRRWKVSDPRKTPTLWKASQRFRKGIASVSTDNRTGLVTLNVVWKDPKIAADWANGLVRMTNDYLRKQALDESQRNITYLTTEAAKTDVVGVKDAISAILENEIDKEMLARGTEEYAFKVLDPAVAPERPSFPRPLLFIALGFVGSIALSILFALAWMSVRAREHAHPPVAQGHGRRTNVRRVAPAATNTPQEDRWR